MSSFIYFNFIDIELDIPKSLNDKNKYKFKYDSEEIIKINSFLVFKREIIKNTFYDLKKVKLLTYLEKSGLMKR